MGAVVIAFDRAMQVALLPPNRQTITIRYADSNFLLVFYKYSSSDSDHLPVIEDFVICYLKRERVVLAIEDQKWCYTIVGITT